jgi:hypothetical protein
MKNDEMAGSAPKATLKPHQCDIKATPMRPEGEGRMQNAECRKERQNCPKPPASHSKAKHKPDASQVLSCVPLVFEVLKQEGQTEHYRDQGYNELRFHVSAPNNAAHWRRASGPELFARGC